MGQPLGDSHVAVRNLCHRLLAACGVPDDIPEHDDAEGNTQQPRDYVAHETLRSAATNLPVCTRHAASIAGHVCCFDPQVLGGKNPYADDPSRPVRSDGAWLASIVAAQPFLGLRSERRLGPDRGRAAAVDLDGAGLTFEVTSGV